MSTFSEIHARAIDRHGEDHLRARFPTASDAATLAALPDHRCLAAMTRRVFAAGFRWSVIDNKWPGFEEAFSGFDVAHVAHLDAEDIESLATDTRIVRNRPKILATVQNAQFVMSVSAEHFSFGTWLAAWPANDRVGLWEAMKKGGSRLGGHTGSLLLRSLGVDTFRFSTDVGQALVDAGVVSKHPTGKGAQRTAQDAIVAWAAESGMSLGAVSVVLASSVGSVGTAGAYPIR